MKLNINFISILAQNGLKTEFFSISTFIKKQGGAVHYLFYKII